MDIGTQSPKYVHWPFFPILGILFFLSNFSGYTIRLKTKASANISKLVSYVT